MWNYVWRLSLFIAQGMSFVVVVLRQGLALSPRLEFSGVIITHCSLHLLGSNDPPTSASLVARTTGAHHHIQVIFFIFLFICFLLF